MVSQQKALRHAKKVKGDDTSAMSQDMPGNMNLGDIKVSTEKKITEHSDMFVKPRTTLLYDPTEFKTESLNVSNRQKQKSGLKMAESGSKLVITHAHDAFNTLLTYLQPQAQDTHF